MRRLLTRRRKSGSRPAVVGRRVQIRLRDDIDTGIQFLDGMTGIISGTTVLVDGVLYYRLKLDQVAPRIGRQFVTLHRKSFVIERGKSRGAK